MKYIVFKTAFESFHVAIFDELISHKDIAQAAHRGRLKPVSAGFAHKLKEGWVASGDSESLKMASVPGRDTFLLRLALEQGLAGLDLMNALTFLEIQANAKG